MPTPDIDRDLVYLYISAPIAKCHTLDVLEAENGICWGRHLRLSTEGLRTVGARARSISPIKSSATPEDFRRSHAKSRSLQGKDLWRSQAKSRRLLAKPCEEPKSSGKDLRISTMTAPPKVAKIMLSDDDVRSWARVIVEVQLGSTM